MVTIKDVANKAGVSPTTVSNVIHGHERRVSTQTVLRIKAIIEEMGYTPNLSARSLVSSSSRIIGIISRPVPLEGGGVLQVPFHGALTAGVDMALREANYYLMLRTIDSVQELLSFLSNWNMDGLILTGCFPQAFYHALRQQSSPFLLVDSYASEEQNMLQIRLEDQKGGYVATKHLLDRGHRRVIFCSPPVLGERGVVHERLAGYRQALAEYNVPFEPDLLCEQATNIDEATALGLSLSKRSDFTAIIATTDTLAAGLLGGLQEGGKRIPGDISIIGFDDLNIGQATSPPLTTVRQNKAEMGRAAVSMLLAAIRGEEQQNTATFPAQLVERRSVSRL